MFFVDSHCHLDQLSYDTIENILKDAKKNNIKFILSISTSISNYLKNKNLFLKYNNVACTCGVHPVNIKMYNETELYKIASQKQVLALGETGLDYFYSIEQKIYQKKSFITHINIAQELKKPIIIHTRCARKDTLSILEYKKENKEYQGIIHCFSEDRETAKKFLDMGFYISFSGIITFKNAGIIRDSVRFVPIDRLLIETDSPYLAPVPYRGKENRPAWMIYIIQVISKIKNISIKKLAQKTTKNFFNLLKIDLKCK